MIKGVLLAVSVALVNGATVYKTCTEHLLEARSQDKIFCKNLDEFDITKSKFPCAIGGGCEQYCCRSKTSPPPTCKDFLVTSEAEGKSFCPAGHVFDGGNKQKICLHSPEECVKQCCLHKEIPEATQSTCHQHIQTSNAQGGTLCRVGYKLDVNKLSSSCIGDCHETCCIENEEYGQIETTCEGQLVLKQSQGKFLCSVKSKFLAEKKDIDCGSNCEKICCSGNEPPTCKHYHEIYGHNLCKANKFDESKAFSTCSEKCDDFCCKTEVKPTCGHYNRLYPNNLCPVHAEFDPLKTEASCTKDCDVFCCKSEEEKPTCGHYNRLYSNHLCPAHSEFDPLKAEASCTQDCDVFCCKKEEKPTCQYYNQKYPASLCPSGYAYDSMKASAACTEDCDKFCCKETAQKNTCGSHFKDYTNLCSGDYIFDYTKSDSVCTQDCSSYCCRHNGSGESSLVHFKAPVRESSLVHFKAPVRHRKLEGENIHIVDTHNDYIRTSLEECAKACLEKGGKSFDYSYFGCYVNSEDRSDQHLTKSARYTYYELLSSDYKYH
eukprot:Awhi_evm1s5219